MGTTDLVCLRKHIMHNHEITPKNDSNTTPFVTSGGVILLENPREGGAFKALFLVLSPHKCHCQLVSMRAMGGGRGGPLTAVKTS